MNAASVDIKDILVAAGLGVFAASSGWSIAIGRQPVSPDQAIAIFDSGSWLSPSAHLLIDYPSIMVSVRGAAGDYTGAYAKALAVRDKLLGLPTQTVSGTIYSGITVRADIFFMGYDETNRPEFTIDFNVTRNPATGTNRRAN
jgi:hypothetical protein